MQALLSPLKCRSYFVTELSLTANPQHDPAKPVHLDFKDLFTNSTTDLFPQEQAQRIWIVSLQIRQNVAPEKNSPYNFAITLLGHFQVHEQYPEDKAKQLAAINGASILYSAARQILRSAMTNGPFPALVLPTVMFQEPPAAAPVAAATAPAQGQP